MARIASLAHITLTSCAACALLMACGDGSGEVPGGVGGSGKPPSGGSAPVAGTASNAGTTDNGGSAPTTGGQPSGGTSTSGNSAGGSSAGGTAAGGQSSGGGSGGDQAAGGSGGTSGAQSGGSAGTGGKGGASSTPDCDDDEELCSGVCVDTDEDAENCGSCGKKCSSGQTCKDGACSGGTSDPVAGCTNITEYGTVSSTIVVKNGQTYDGKCKRYRADPDELGDGSQAEGQKPVFIVENGGKLLNVVLGAPAADGIHTKGSVTLENITWEDIGEDAMTIKEGGTVILNGGSAKNGEDKVFQINAASTFRVSNFKAQNAGKFIRQNGGTTFKTQVYIDECDISDMEEAVFRTDSSTSTVSFTNSRYHNIGDSLFIGVSSGNITQSNNTSY